LRSSSTARIGGAVDPERLVEPRHDEQQPDPGCGDDVRQRVEPVVARHVRDGQVVVVEDGDPSRRAAARRYVEVALRVARRHHHERHEGDERAIVLFEPVELLGQRATGGWPVVPPQLVEGRDPLGRAGRHRCLLSGA